MPQDSIVETEIIDLLIKSCPGLVFQQLNAYLLDKDLTLAVVDLEKEPKNEQQQLLLF